MPLRVLCFCHHACIRWTFLQPVTYAVVRILSQWGFCWKITGLNQTFSLPINQERRSWEKRDYCSATAWVFCARYSRTGMWLVVAGGGVLKSFYLVQGISPGLKSRKAHASSGIIRCGFLAQAPDPGFWSKVLDFQDEKSHSRSMFYPVYLLVQAPSYPGFWSGDTDLKMTSIRPSSSWLQLAP